jgi:hypothetical protein
MTIYTRFGSEVEILAWVGEDSGTNAFQEKVQGEWVTVRYLEDPTRALPCSISRASGKPASKPSDLCWTTSSFGPTATNSSNADGASTTTCS